MDIPILSPRKEWACPNCSQTDVTTEARPHTRYHSCPGLRGLSAPFVPAAEVESKSVRVRAVEREDYAGRHHVTKDDDGRVIMAINTERADGSNDVAVLAPGINVEVIQ